MFMIDSLVFKRDASKKEKHARLPLFEQNIFVCILIFDSLPLYYYVCMWLYFTDIQDPKNVNITLSIKDRASNTHYTLFERLCNFRCSYIVWVKYCIVVRMLTLRMSIYLDWQSWCRVIQPINIIRYKNMKHETTDKQMAYCKMNVYGNGWSE